MNKDYDTIIITEIYLKSNDLKGGIALYHKTAMGPVLIENNQELETEYITLKLSNKLRITITKEETLDY